MKKGRMGVIVISYEFCIHLVYLCMCMQIKYINISLILSNLIFMFGFSYQNRVHILFHPLLQQDNFGYAQFRFRYLLSDNSSLHHLLFSVYNTYTTKYLNVCTKIPLSLYEVQSYLYFAMS